MNAKLLLAIGLACLIVAACATTATQEPLKCADPATGVDPGIGDCGVKPTTAY